MRRRKEKMLRGWDVALLGAPDVATVVMGQSPPGRTYNTNGEGLPFYQGKADFGDVSPSPRVWCTDPKKIAEPGDILLSVRAPVGPTNLANEQCCIGRGLAAIRGGRKSLTKYLYFWFKHIETWLSDQGEGSTFRAIGKNRIEGLKVPLPPLPVQERIVQILQKADEIRRKRREALGLKQTIRRALFIDMFGEPQTNPRQWPSGPLNDLLSPEIESVNPTRAFPDKEFTYIEIAGIEAFQIVKTKQLLGRDAPSRARQVVRAGDVLYSMTRPNLRKIAIVPDELDGAICTTGFAVLRPRRPEDTPFVFEIVKSDYFTETMSQLAQAKSLYPAVDEAQVRQFNVIQPPAPVRSHFGAIVTQLTRVSSSSHASFELAEALFSSLLSRAFTGELTAEWEAENAEWIAKRQSFYERLPQLVLLAFLVEKARRAGRRSAEAVMLVTALMKYAFLLQMEGNSRRRFYNFVPYHYGPFAKELYTDLRALHETRVIYLEEFGNRKEGGKGLALRMVAEEQAPYGKNQIKGSEERRIKIALSDPDRAEEMLAELPDDLKEDIGAVLDAYGDLDHNTLLKTVYEKYPAYAKKSRVRRRKLK